ncbi:MAG: hypothetical protein C4336_09605 [Armatimonadota bacterium]
MLSQSVDPLPHMVKTELLHRVVGVEPVTIVLDTGIQLGILMLKGYPNVACGGGVLQSIGKGILRHEPHG